MAERATDAVVLTERFYSKTVEVQGPLPTPCRIWTGRVETNGRGRFWYANKPVLAYRVSCAAAEGKSLADIDGLVVLHECDNPLCVAPGHLHSGTQAENMRDMANKGRGGGFLADPSKRYRRTR